MHQGNLLCQVHCSERFNEDVADPVADVDSEDCQQEEEHNREVDKAESKAKPGSCHEIAEAQGQCQGMERLMNTIYRIQRQRVIHAITINGKRESKR
jgi:hypothetical protein